MKSFTSLGNIGRTVRATSEKPKNIVGKYQKKFAVPKTIAEDIVNPRIAFLESVKKIKVMNKKHMISKINFLIFDFLGLFDFQ